MQENKDPADTRISEKEAVEAGYEKITDVGVISQLIVDWHMHIKNSGQHILNIDNTNPDDPQRIGIRVREPDHPDADETGHRFLSQGAEEIAFKHGVRCMLDLIDTLPFHYTPVDADDNPLPGYTDTPKEQHAEEAQQVDKDSGT